MSAASLRNGRGRGPGIHRTHLQTLPQVSQLCAGGRPSRAARVLRVHPMRSGGVRGREQVGEALGSGLGLRCLELRWLREQVWMLTMSNKWLLRSSGEG